mmetsp:Transcript_19574/g.41013  ORF Transcript_19574/g.41013 Transcript_19574/m.41013 type:complete len:243 (+) Transcript_19574:134-862(+)
MRAIVIPFLSILHIFHLNLIRRTTSKRYPRNNNHRISNFRNPRNPTLPQNFLRQLHGLFERIHDEGITPLQKSKALTSHLRARRENRNGHTGTELGNMTSRRSRLGKDDDAFGSDVDGGLDGRGRQRFGRRKLVSLPDGISHRLIQFVPVDGTFRLAARAHHDLDGLTEVLSVGRLAGEHDGVGSVVARVGDVGTFGAGGAGVFDHGFEHLGGGDDGFAGDVGFADHVFLGEEDFFGWDFHS